MKRFTQTEKWQNPTYRALSVPAKLLLGWLNDHCDNAGIITPDIQGASFHIGQTVDESHIAELKPWLNEISKGTYWIQGFIYFQFGNVPPPGTSAKMAPLHQTIWNSLASHNLTYTNPRPSLRQAVKGASSTGSPPVVDPSTKALSKGKGKSKGNQEGFGEENQSGSGKKKPNDVFILIREWKRIYFPAFNTVYADKKRDWSAAKNLLKSTGFTPMQIIDVAKKAMTRRGPGFWACENRTQEFSDFCNDWNRINAEINSQPRLKPNDRNFGIATDTKKSGARTAAIVARENPYATP
jgi:hypothetical protein